MVGSVPQRQLWRMYDALTCGIHFAPLSCWRSNVPKPGRNVALAVDCLPMLWSVLGAPVCGNHTMWENENLIWSSGENLWTLESLVKRNFAPSWMVETFSCVEELWQAFRGAVFVIFSAYLRGIGSSVDRDCCSIVSQCLLQTSEGEWWRHWRPPAESPSVCLTGLPRFSLSAMIINIWTRSASRAARTSCPVWSWQFQELRGPHVITGFKVGLASDAWQTTKQSTTQKFPKSVQSPQRDPETICTTTTARTIFLLSENVTNCHSHAAAQPLLARRGGQCRLQTSRDTWTMPVEDPHERQCGVVDLTQTLRRDQIRNTDAVDGDRRNLWPQGAQTCNWVRRFWTAAHFNEKTPQRKKEKGNGAGTCKKAGVKTTPTAKFVLQSLALNSPPKKDLATANLPWTNLDTRGRPQLCWLNGPGPWHLVQSHGLTDQAQNKPWPNKLACRTGQNGIGPWKNWPKPKSEHGHPCTLSWRCHNLHGQNITTSTTDSDLTRTPPSSHFELHQATVDEPPHGLQTDTGRKSEASLHDGSMGSLDPSAVQVRNTLHNFHVTVKCWKTGRQCRNLLAMLPCLGREERNKSSFPLPWRLCHRNPLNDRIGLGRPSCQFLRRETTEEKWFPTCQHSRSQT